jgi:hypothetical protein
MFQGAHLSVYGSDSEFIGAVLPALKLVTDHMRQAVSTGDAARGVNRVVFKNAGAPAKFARQQQRPAAMIAV